MSSTTDNSPAENTTSTVRVEKLVYGGEGLGRVDGQVVLIPYVLPGEEVAVETQRVKKGLLRAVRANVTEKAEHRAVPRCEYFEGCGGCHYQHADYEMQLAAKESILRETLARLGSLNFDREIKMASGEPWGYRNRVQLHFANGRSGFYRAGSHEIYGIEHCDISSPVLNEVIGKLAWAVRQPQWPKFLQSLEVFTNESDVQLTITDSTRPVAVRFFEWCGTFLPNVAAGAIDYQAANHKFRISRGSFFQVNRFLMEDLVQEVTGDATGDSALDLYAGAGLFTLPLAERYRQVTAVERGGAPYRDLEWNVREKEGQIDVVKGSAEDYLKSLTDAPELIVADPPRVGLGKEVTEELLRIGAPQMVLVSCDPATLARDLKALAGTYKVESLTLVDLFPQTYHFETIARLARA